MFKFEIADDLYLKLLSEREAEELFALIDVNREHLKQWLPWVEGVKQVADSKSFIEGTREQFAANNGFQAGIWYQGQLVGVIGYHKIDWDNKKTTIGYWLDQGQQGNGIITRACKAMIDYAFETLNLNRVEISCAEENKKSRAVPERLGFTREGVLREVEWLYDHFVNHVVYGMLSSEWD